MDYVFGMQVADCTNELESNAFDGSHGQRMVAFHILQK